MADLVACDLRALALFRLLLAAAVAINSMAYESPLALIVLVPALTLFFGYRSYWSAIACWTLTAALQVLNPASDAGSDSMLSALLLLSIFLPLGARFSVDSALDPAHALALDAAGLGRRDHLALALAARAARHDRALDVVAPHHLRDARRRPAERDRRRERGGGDGAGEEALHRSVGLRLGERGRQCSACGPRGRVRGTQPAHLDAGH